MGVWGSSAAGMPAQPAGQLTAVEHAESVRDHRRCALVTVDELVVAGHNEVVSVGEGRQIGVVISLLWLNGPSVGRRSGH